MSAPLLFQICVGVFLEPALDALVRARDGNAGLVAVYRRRPYDCPLRLALDKRVGECILSCAGLTLQGLSSLLFAEFDVVRARMAVPENQRALDRVLAAVPPCLSDAAGRYRQSAPDNPRRVAVEEYFLHLLKETPALGEGRMEDRDAKFMLAPFNEHFNSTAPETRDLMRWMADYTRGVNFWDMHYPWMDQYLDGTLETARKVAFEQTCLRYINYPGYCFPLCKMQCECLLFASPIHLMTPEMRAAMGRVLSAPKHWERPSIRRLMRRYRSSGADDATRLMTEQSFVYRAESQLYARIDTVDANAVATVQLSSIYVEAILHRFEDNDAAFSCGVEASLDWVLFLLDMQGGPYARARRTAIERYRESGPYSWRRRKVHHTFLARWDEERELEFVTDYAAAGELLASFATE